MTDVLLVVIHRVIGQNVNKRKIIMATIIEAPNYSMKLKDINNTKLFLAGGITNCEDWQKIMIKYLKNIDKLTIYNPRRENFPIDDKQAALKQITWEYNALHESSIILFWFCNTTLNPIVLYELGKWGNSSQYIPIFIGIEPGYKREEDVKIQTALARPKIKIVNNLKDLSLQIINHIKKGNKI